MNQPKENGHGDGGVAEEKEPGKDARAGGKGRSEFLVIEAEGLQKAGSAVGQVQREQKKPNDIKSGDVNVLKSINHHRENIVMIEWIVFEQRKLRIEFMAREMEEMENDKREDDDPAHDHVS